MALSRSPLAPANFPELPAVRGVLCATARLGLYAQPREDLLVFSLAPGCAVGGALTNSATRSADVEWCRSALAHGRARALVCNAGNSNAFTGPAGVAKNAATVAAVTAALGCAAHEVYLCATGVIGQPLAPRRVADALMPLWPQLGPPDWQRAAKAFSTTDTFPKGAGAISEIGGADVRIAGIAKGSGMIQPNMATMLAFVFTDAALSPALVQGLVSRHVCATFNSITVDGDTSTSDTLLLFATGASDAPLIERLDDPRLAGFEAALHGVMHDLALQIVRDGEGAQKLIEIQIEGAQSEESARRIGFSIANSPLVKTAIAGGDANWGRVIMAVGKAGEPINLARLAVRFCGHWTARDGGAIPYDSALVDAALAQTRVEVLVDVGVGDGRATVWTCDLTKGYIEINGDYRS
jgi:glutamate N-acetyltransferase / amino-acid N-acetyltransferase